MLPTDVLHPNLLFSSASNGSRCLKAVKSSFDSAMGKITYIFHYFHIFCLTSLRPYVGFQSDEAGN